MAGGTPTGSRCAPPVRQPEDDGTRQITAEPRHRWSPAVSAGAWTSVAGGGPPGRGQAAALDRHAARLRRPAPARLTAPARHTSAGAEVACGELFDALRRCVTPARTGGSAGEPEPASALGLASAAPADP